MPPRPVTGGTTEVPDISPDARIILVAPQGQSGGRQQPLSTMIPKSSVPRIDEEANGRRMVRSPEKAGANSPKGVRAAYVVDERGTRSFHHLRRFTYNSGYTQRALGVLSPVANVWIGLITIPARAAPASTQRVARAPHGHTSYAGRPRWKELYDKA